MGKTINVIIDGQTIRGRPGQSVLQAAEEAGIYIPRLCYMKGLVPHGSCRICTVYVNGRPQSSCTQPIAEGMFVEANSDRLLALRRNLVEMLFVEGNHFCMFCEKSGNCELQALAYRFGVTTPKYPYLWPKREVDASHPDILIDRNRCILCARCVRASRDVDGKHVFGFLGRGPQKRVAVNADLHLGETNAEVSDEAMSVCPVGALMPKRVGFEVPIGQRLYDIQPIGSDVAGPDEKKP
ncbi:MAG: 2Fe-2S iron-sulfur cluster-binding protein [Planctomycetota bacterium]|jgi:[NiFe] hydrogenase diaphorase moiety small subunit